MLLVLIPVLTGTVNIQDDEKVRFLFTENKVIEVLCFNLLACPYAV